MQRVTAADVLAAYTAVMNPATPQAARAGASAYLEALKLNPVLCRDAAVDLMSNRPAPEAQHLAALLMENVVKLHWPSLSPGQRAQVRKDVVAILANVGLTEPKYVKEKIASLLNEVAKRDWPQEWPEYFDSLISISNVGDGQREMVLLVIRRLVEDVTHFSHDLAKNRCDQLMNELKSKSKTMIAFILQGLQVQQQLWVESRRTAIVAARLAAALIETLGCFFSWAAPQVLFEANVPDALMTFLGDVHNLRMPAAEGLLALAERDHGKISMASKFLFPIEKCALFSRALESPFGTAAEKIAFQEVVGKILVAAGKKHLVLVEKHNFAVPPNYPEYLAIMGRFLEHPDLVFCETTIPFFNHLLRTDVFKNSPAFDAVAPAMTLAFVKKLVGGISPDVIQFVQEAHFGDDDDDDKSKERIGEFLSRFTAMLKDVVRKLALLRPGLVLGVALTECGKSFPVLRNASPNLSSYKSLEYLLLQGCIDVMDAVMKNGVPYEETMQSANQRLKEQLSESIRSLLLLFYEFETVNPLLLGLKIKSLRCFALYYRRNPKVLTSVLEKLLGMVLFRTQNESGKPHIELTKMTLKVRKEACESFLRLCVELPDVLVDQLGPISSHVVEKLIKGDTSFIEKAILRDALVSISTAVRDPAQQKAYVLQVIGPVLSAWTGSAMTDTVGDCGKLLSWVGAAPNMAPLWDNGRALVSVLETFRTTIKRSPTSCLEIIPQLLPNVFLLCRTLHRLWKPGHAAHAFLRAQLPAVFAPDQSLYASLVGRKLERNFPMFVAAWLTETRETAYKVIGVSCKLPQFYLIPDLAGRLNAYVFAEMQDISMQHLTMLVEHVIQNLLMHTPEAAYGSFLGPLLPGLISFLLERLFGCWNMETAIRKGETRENTEDEVVQMKLSMDFSRSWFRVLLHVLHVEKNPNLKGKDGHAVASPLCMFMTSTPNVVIGVLASLLGALCDTCDSQTLSHVMEILERLIGMLLNNAALHNVLGGHLFRSLLKAVSKRANNEHVQRCLRIAAEIYVRLRNVSPAPLAVLKSTGVTAKQISALETRLRADADGTSKKTPKNRAQALMETLGDFVGGDVVGLSEGPAAVLELLKGR